jgi:hypothetical protein
MLPKARSEVETYCGQPCIRLTTAQGDSALVALHGAQVLSWVAGGRERLYLSPQAVFDGQIGHPWRHSAVLSPVQPARAAAQAWLCAQSGLACRWCAGRGGRYPAVAAPDG